MGLNGNWIMVPPQLRQVAYQALNANQGAGLNQIVAPPLSVLGAEEGYRIIVNHLLTDVNDWYLLHVADGVSPFIYQTRIPPTFEPLLEGTDVAIRMSRFLYGVRARYEVGVGDPRHIVKVTNT
jgi:phage major head subunit gpT-like protein